MHRLARPPPTTLWRTAAPSRYLTTSPRTAFLASRPTPSTTTKTLAERLQHQHNLKQAQNIPSLLDSTPSDASTPSAASPSASQLSASSPAVASDPSSSSSISNTSERLDALVRFAIDRATSKVPTRPLERRGEVPWHESSDSRTQTDLDRDGVQLPSRSVKQLERQLVEAESGRGERLVLPKFKGIKRYKRETQDEIDAREYARPRRVHRTRAPDSTNDTDGRLRGAQERIENQERALARRESRLAVLREAAIPWEERSEVDRKQLLMETLHEYEVKQRKAKAKVARKKLAREEKRARAVVGGVAGPHDTASASGPTSPSDAATPSSTLPQSDSSQPEGPTEISEADASSIMSKSDHVDFLKLTRDTYMKQWTIAVAQVNSINSKLPALRQNLATSKESLARILDPANAGKSLRDLYIDRKKEGLRTRAQEASTVVVEEFDQGEDAVVERGAEQEGSATQSKRQKKKPSLLSKFADKVTDAPPKPKKGTLSPVRTGEELSNQLNGLDDSRDLPPHISSESAPSKTSNKGKSTSRSNNDPSAAPARRTRSSLPAVHLPPLSSYKTALSPSSTPITALPLSPVPIATLSHGLTRVLFNPGVHFLRDPRTGVYNFPPDVLEKVPKLDEFSFDKLPQYVTSSKDEVLKGIAKEQGKKIVGSTSSTVAMLCQIYFWLSKAREVNLDMLSAPWSNASKEFSMGQRLPASIVMHHDGEAGYSIDADKSMDPGVAMNVLAEYGHLMEKLLTTPAPEFARFLSTSSDPAPSQADDKQAYHYATTEHMVLRSQLDAHNDLLPNKSFDLKTRGSVAIRQDRLNYEESAGYTIDRLQGEWESFEREYYDLIRSAFLKYQFQARIGHMDGCFLAYHSTQRFFGFQYIPVTEMDVALFGSTHAGEQIFPLCVGFLEKLLLEAQALYPSRSLRLTFSAGTEKEDVLRVFVQPAEAEGDSDLTLLELKGTNYVDGRPTRQVDIAPSPPTMRVPTWEVGYDILESFTDDSSALRDRFVSTAGNVPSEQIKQLLAKARETQQMFSSLALPTGVDRAMIVEAAKRAKDAGESLEVDPSDLATRFPIVEGVEYRNQPTKGVKALRQKARIGARRTEEADARGREQGIVEIESVLRSRSEKDEEEVVV